MPIELWLPSTIHGGLGVVVDCSDQAQKCSWGQVMVIENDINVQRSELMEVASLLQFYDIFKPLSDWSVLNKTPYYKIRTVSCALH